MQSWSLAHRRSNAAHRALTGIIEGLGGKDFASTALEELCPVLGIGSWSVYTRYRDRPPVMHLSASYRVADSTGECFAIYRDHGLYREDSSFDPVLDARPHEPILLRMSADQAPTPAHRDAIYLRHGMVERLSIARKEKSGPLLAVNVYHHSHQGAFTDEQVEQFGDIGVGLIAVVARHLEWVSSAAPKGHRQLLKRRCGTLTERELDVLERLLQGMTYDGVASDMGISFASVKTYRKRAFERLDIHFRNELFASFLHPAVNLSGDSAGTVPDTHFCPSGQRCAHGWKGQE